MPLREVRQLVCDLCGYTELNSPRHRPGDNCPACEGPRDAGGLTPVQRRKVDAAIYDDDYDPMGGG